jgi:hypothetical protein
MHVNKGGRGGKKGPETIGSTLEAQVKKGL